jgi:hypothetical protein
MFTPKNVTKSVLTCVSYRLGGGCSNRGENMDTIGSCQAGHGGFERSQLSPIEDMALSHRVGQATFIPGKRTKSMKACGLDAYA